MIRLACTNQALVQQLVDIIIGVDPEPVETMSNPRYTLELFIRVVTVNLETIKIVCALPKLDIAA